MKKVIFVANIGFTLTNFRNELMQSFRDKGYIVRIVCPLENDFNSNLNNFKNEIIPINVSRHGLNPIEDLKLFIRLIRILRIEKPQIVFNYTIKPTIYSSLAAFIVGVPQIFSTITGLGYIFTGKTFIKSVLVKFISILYRLALSTNTKVFFQNPDDQSLFVSLGLVKLEKAKIINGSGVNLKKFCPLSNSKKIPQSFLFIGRLLKDKGIGELIEAMKIIKNKYPNAKLRILGNTDDNPASFSMSDVKNWEREGIINYINPTEDVRPYLNSHEVFVLPSYREGTPRSVLEAMAMGLPIITTDAPGCRETVVDGVNGFLVPVKSVEILADKMEKFLERPGLISQMGLRGLEIVQQKYDVQKVNESILEEVIF